MNEEILSIIMVTIFCGIGFWVLITSSLLIFVKTAIKVLVSYKTVDAFGRLSTADFEDNWFEIILANNKIIRIYAVEIKTKKMNFAQGFVFCQIKYNLFKLRWENKGLYMVITGENINRPINGYFGDCERSNDE